MASRVQFCPIVAVQSKLEASSPPDSRAEYCSASSAVDHRQRVPLLHFSKHSDGPDLLCKSSPSDGSTPPGRTTPSASTASGWTTCTSLHPVTDTTPPGRSTPSASAALGQTTCTSLQSPSDGHSTSWMYNFYSSANGGAATEARSHRGTRASWARTPFTVCGPGLQRFSLGRHRAPSRPRRG